MWNDTIPQYYLTGEGFVPKDKQLEYLDYMRFMMSRAITYRDGKGWVIKNQGKPYVSEKVKLNTTPTTNIYTPEIDFRNYKIRFGKFNND